MDAEKELCDLLDDLDISWWKIRDGICWTTNQGGVLSACQCYVRKDGRITLANYIYNLTPSQVIDHTLKIGQANRIVINKGDYGTCHCSKCDKSISESFIYCPYCGSKFLKTIYKSIK